LRSNNGGEYTFSDLKDFCKEVGIKRELTVSYNPQHKWVAERENRSIINSAKAMIHDHELPMFLWAEACNTAIYVQNKSAQKILGDKTPEEAFTGMKPEIGHLRIFGCALYIHVPMEKRTKLETLVEKGIFVGYNETSKSYRIFIQMQRKTIVSRDVKFEENLASSKSHELPPMAEDKKQEALKGE
jgi:hypothetical protein